MTALCAMRPEFHLSLRLADDAVVAVAGELDLYTVDEFAGVLHGLVDRGHTRITVECDELQFIDASGLGALIAARNRLDTPRGEIRVHGLSPVAYRLFEITGLVDRLDARCRAASPDAFPDDGGATDGVVSRVSSLLAESSRAEALSAVLALSPMLVANGAMASVTLRRGDEFVTAAASDETARQFDGMQHSERSGPCVDAATGGDQIHAAALVDERRWPMLMTRARQRGVDSVLSSPLLVADEPAGALTLYSPMATGFAPADRERATALDALVTDRYHGDLRQLRAESRGDVQEARRRLKECKGIGDVGADIFLREAQGVWPEYQPFFGEPALHTAAELGLPGDADDLARRCRPADLPRLAAALIRVRREGDDVRQRLRKRAA